MKNTSKLISIRGFEKEFQKMEPYLRKADKRDVRDAIQVQHARNAGDLHSVSKDGDFRIGGTMPSSFWFNPIMAKVPTAKLTQEEWDAWWTAWGNTYDKFKSKRTHRDKMFV